MTDVQEREGSEEDHASHPSSGEVVEDNIVLGDRISGEEPEEPNTKKFDDERSPVFETRVEKATEFWEQGKTRFRDGDYKQALELFERGLYQVDFDELSYEFELMDKHREAVEKVRIPLWLNAAACLLKEQRFKETIDYCDKILKKDSSSVKALYRRSKARESLGQYDEALSDLEQAHQIAKEDVDVLKALVALRKRVAAAQKEVDAIWKGKLKITEKPVESNAKSFLAATAGSVEGNFVSKIIALFWAIITWLTASLTGFGGGNNKKAQKRED